MENIRPITVTHEGNDYTLEFDNESVVFTNRQGFKRSEFFDNIEEMLPILWYGAFRKHHKNVSRSQTDNILKNALGGLTADALNRLIELYSVPRNSLIREDDNEDAAKNRTATIQL